MCPLFFLETMMKLQTSIPARRDGTLTVQGLDKKAYPFTLDAEGVLTGDVEDEATVAHLLATDNFYPVNPEDYDAALQLAAGGQGGEGEGDDGEGGEGDDDIEQPAGGLPVEANSPLKPLPDAKAGGKPRKAK
jgi:hypothetical protein